MKITHTCGHEVTYKALKDKKGTAARSCPACEHAARRANPAVPKTVYLVPDDLLTRPGFTPRIIVPKGADEVPHLVVEARSDRVARRGEVFATRAEAEARIRDLVRAGTICLVESDRTREEALDDLRDRLAMQAEDRREATERTARAMDRPHPGPVFDPDAEDADEVLFGTH